MVLLVVLWTWESVQPFFPATRERWVHAGRNLTLALGNVLLLAGAFGYLTFAVTDWAATQRVGLLHFLDLPVLASFALALVLVDLWMYFWHRANHALPFLWRFHRMHHSDDRMDVTTATRFHPGELILSSALRLVLIPLLGLSLAHLLVYETLALAVTQLHHANVSLGPWDGYLRWLVVTPDLHKVHHSRERAETDSNYATVLPWWDYLAGTFRMRADPATIHLGLAEFDEPRWRTLPGMLALPLARTTPPAGASP